MSIYIVIIRTISRPSLYGIFYIWLIRGRPTLYIQFNAAVPRRPPNLRGNRQNRRRQIITATFVTRPIFLAQPLPETRNKIHTRRIPQYVTRANRATTIPGTIYYRVVIIVSLPNGRTFEFMWAQPTNNSRRKPVAKECE